MSLLAASPAGAVAEESGETSIDSSATYGQVSHEDPAAATSDEATDQPDPAASGPGEAPAQPLHEGIGDGGAAEPVEEPGGYPAQPGPEPVLSLDEEDPLRWVGTVQRLSHGLPGDDGPRPTMLFMPAYGYLLLDATTLPSDVTGRVAVTVAAPKGVDLGESRQDAFAALAGAGALTVTGVFSPNQVKARSIAGNGVSAGVNLSPIAKATHRIHAVLVTPNGLGASPDSHQQDSVVRSAVQKASAYWSKQSNGQITLELQTVIPWYQAPAGASCADDSARVQLWNSAWQKVKQVDPYSLQGALERPNDHLVLVLPAAAKGQCGPGLGTLGDHVNSGGTLQLTGLNSAVGLATLKHELGHNFSFGHANWLECRVSSFGSALNLPKGDPMLGTDTGECLNREYGDLLDIMGFGVDGKDGGSLSAPNAIRAGLWKAGTDYAVAASGTTKRYTLKDVGNTSGLRSVIVQDVDGATFFVEYRNLKGTDAQYAGMGQYCSVAAGSGYCTDRGVRILRAQNDPDYGGAAGAGYNGRPWDQTQLIGRSTGPVGEYDARYQHRSTFRAGETFRNTSSAGAVKVKVVSTSASSAVIEVTSPKGSTQLPLLNGDDEDLQVWSASYTYRVGDPIWVQLPDTYVADQYTYKWTRINMTTATQTVIKGATKSYYIPVAADLDHALAVTVTLKRNGASSKSALIRTVANVVGENVFGIQPHVIEGPGQLTIVQAGSSLKAQLSQLSTLDAPWRYQWYRNGKAIKDATKASYKPTSSDKNARIKVRVQAPKTSTGWVMHDDSLPPEGGTWQIFSDEGYYNITSTQKPAIAGALRVGETLYATLGNFQTGPASDSISVPVTPTLTYQWQRDGKSISGAKSATYTLKAADKGKKISVKVTAKSGALLTLTQTSSKTSKVASGVIAGSKSPGAVTRNASTGLLDAKLTAGVITQSGVTTKYQWYRAGKKIKGATKATYKPVNADFDKTLKVRVTVTKKAYTTVVMDRTAPKSLYQVEWDWDRSLDGTLAVGSTIQMASHSFRLDGSIVDGSALDRKWQWLRDGKAIKNATGETYTVTSADRGKRLSVKLTFRVPGTITGSVTSRKTVKVGDVAFADAPDIQQQWREREPVDTAVVNGKVVLSAPLPGDGAGRDGIADLSAKRAYQWYRDGKAITGATKATYTPGSGDANGKRLHVRVTISKSGYTPVEVYSLARAFSVYGATKPKILGTAKVGVTLQAVPQGTAQIQKNTTAGATATSEITVNYQWLRDGKTIPGAVTSLYTPVKVDVGKKLSVRVTYRHASNGYVSQVVTSAKTKKVVK